MYHHNPFEFFSDSGLNALTGSHDEIGMAFTDNEALLAGEPVRLPEGQIIPIKISADDLDPGTASWLNGDVVPQSIIGPDDRVPVLDATGYPWSTIGRVESEFNGGLSSIASGTGVMVSPYHVLTNAHVANPYAERVRVTLNRSESVV